MTPKFLENGLVPNAVIWEHRSSPLLGTRSGRALRFGLLRFHGAWSSDPTYVYEVRGKEYSGRRVMFIDPVEFLPEDELLRLQDTPSTCFANPDEPWDSVVVRELPLRASVVGMPAVAALAAGVWVFWSGYRRRSAPRV